MEGRLLNNKMEILWEEAAEAQFEVVSWHVSKV
jgi:hypothetical protein